MFESWLIGEIKLLKQTLFAVPMTCGSCVKAVSDSVYKLEGISKVEANLEDQLVSIEGTGEDQFSFLPRGCLTVRRAYPEEQCP